MWDILPNALFIRHQRRIKDSISEILTLADRVINEAGKTPKGRRQLRCAEKLRKEQIARECPYWS